MNNKLFKTMLTGACLAALFTACEKVSMTEEATPSESGDDGLVTVTLRVSDVENMIGPGTTAATTRTMTSIADVATRLNFLVYQDGSKVKTINQKSDDSSFGTVSVSLAPGSYQLLVLGHSCAANPTTASPEKIQFNNTETSYSDTFYHYGDLTVGDEDGETEAELHLKRAVSLFRLTICDAKPAQVAKLRLYYSGGSGALNALTGYGCVNSKQTMWFDLNSQSNAPYTCDAYTFLHNDTGTLKVTATAYSANDEVLYEHTFNEVSMERNHITEYSGNFFVSDDEPNDNPIVDNPDTPSTDTPRGIKIMVDPEWSGTTTVNF